MRLLHVSPFYAHPAWGGIARASRELCRALARRGHEVHVLTARLAAGDAEREDDGGVRVWRLAGPRVAVRARLPWPLGAGAALRELGSFTVFHLHGVRHGLAGPLCRWARRAGTPLVVQPHGTHPHHDRHRLAKRAFDTVVGDRVWRSAAAVVALSAAEARELPRTGLVVANGVDPLPPPVAAVAVDALRLLFVGNASAQKRGALLPALLDAIPQARLQVVGPVDARFGAGFARFGTRVSFAGVLAGESLAAAYGAAALVVHPAVGEAFGLVPFEAALAGTAAVVAGDHGCGEWFRKAGGACVTADDPRALAAAVATRLADPALAAREATSVAAFATEHLTWDAAAARLEELYADLVARPGAGH